MSESKVTTSLVGANDTPVVNVPVLSIKLLNPDPFHGANETNVPVLVTAIMAALMAVFIELLKKAMANEVPI